MPIEQLVNEALNEALNGAPNLEGRRDELISRAKELGTLRQEYNIGIDRAKGAFATYFSENFSGAFDLSRFEEFYAQLEQVTLDNLFPSHRNLSDSERSILLDSVLPLQQLKNTFYDAMKQLVETGQGSLPTGQRDENGNQRNIRITNPYDLVDHAFSQTQSHILAGVKTREHNLSTELTVADVIDLIEPLKDPNGEFIRPLQRSGYFQSIERITPTLQNFNNQNNDGSYFLRDMKLSDAAQVFRSNNPRARGSLFSDDQVKEAGHNILLAASHFDSYHPPTYNI